MEEDLDYGRRIEGGGINGRRVFYMRLGPFFRKPGAKKCRITRGIYELFRISLFNRLVD